MFKTFFLGLFLCSTSFLAAACGMDPSTFYWDDSESDSETTERIPAIPPQWFAQWDIDYAEMQAVARGEGPMLEPEDFQDMRVQAEANIRHNMQADEIRDLTTAGTPLGEYMSAIARGDAYTAFAHYKSLANT